ncbi:hypothetical protein R5R35_006324 [Gryllus longicercus]|uniref:Peptidase S1 domain-containing protein n=1 Tax=Gryllus longicercus TaxID=2509291 RepID=A0AAN9VBN6_9ORTH
MWYVCATMFFLMSRGMSTEFNQRFIQNINIESAQDLQKIYPNNPFFQLVTTRITTPQTTASEIAKSSENYVKSSDVCGRTVNKPNTLIVNGLKTNQGDWPWITAIFLRKQQNDRDSVFICGGNLISELHIVSAGHCFMLENSQTLNANILDAYLGIFDLRKKDDPNVQLKKVQRIIVHPDFKYGTYSDADIAILRLKSPAEYTPHVRPICLWKWTADSRDIVGKKGTVIGWGRSELGEAPTDEPQLVELPVVSQEECRRSDPRFRFLTSQRTLCAGAKDDSGPCNGDSGNGLILRVKDDSEFRWYLRGLTSTSLLDKSRNVLCNLRQYIIFTDVAQYDLWLKNVLTEE